MLQDLADESESQALEINKSNTKVMIKTTLQYKLKMQIENVESYIYQEQRHHHHHAVGRDATKLLPSLDCCSPFISLL